MKACLSLPRNVLVPKYAVVQSFMTHNVLSLQIKIGLSLQMKIVFVPPDKDSADVSFTRLSDTLQGARCTWQSERSCVEARNLPRYVLAPWCTLLPPVPPPLPRTMPLHHLPRNIPLPPGTDD